MTSKCLICNIECDFEREPKYVAAGYYDCPICGRYLAGLGHANVSISSLTNDRNWILSGIIRQWSERSENEGRYYDLMVKNVKEIVDFANVPKMPMDKVDKLLTYLLGKSDVFGKQLLIHPDSQYPLCFAKNSNEMEALVELAESTGYIRLARGIDIAESQIRMQFELAPKGWDRVAELQKKSPLGNQCFVAMWFDNSFYNRTYPSIKNAVEAAGYQSYCAKEKHIANKICDGIVSEIRKSSLMIADITGNRHAVYFEAGFAQSLHIPIIWVYSKHGEEVIKPEDNFDVRQYQHFAYDTHEELELYFSDRINALYPLNK